MKKNLIIIIILLLTFNSLNVSAISKEGDLKIEKEEIQGIKNVGLYKEPIMTFTMEEDIKYSKVMKVIEEHFKKQDIAVSNNIDDIEYQSLVKALGMDFDSFDENIMSEVIEFVKFIDLYENIEKNKEIKRLLNKYNEKTITADEISILVNLAPMSDKDNSTVDIDKLENNKEPIAAPLTLFKNGYNNTKAINYAYKWTDNYKKLRNTNQYGYYSVNANDCTNFVSQCLKEGGMKHRSGVYTSTSAWFYNNTKPSHTWGGANNFYKHWKTRSGIATSSANLSTGDVVSADFSDDGDIDHAAIITKDNATSSSNSSKNKYLTQHTTDRKEYNVSKKIAYTLKQWYDSNYKVYGYEMDKAQN